MENSARFDEALFNTRRIFKAEDTSEKLFDMIQSIRPRLSMPVDCQQNHLLKWVACSYSLQAG